MEQKLAYESYDDLMNAQDWHDKLADLNETIADCLRKIDNLSG